MVGIPLKINNNLKGMIAVFKNAGIRVSILLTGS